LITGRSMGKKVSAEISIILEIIADFAEISIILEIINMMYTYL